LKGLSRGELEPARNGYDPMDDPHVRAAFHKRVLQEHWKNPDALVIDELGICHGYARVDIAVVNGQMHGYEIKSEVDSLCRLGHQAHVYSAVLDRVTLVTHERHLDKALSLIPDWWGIKVASRGSRGGISFAPVRRAERNEGINPIALVEFLWRAEAVNALEKQGALGNLRGKSKSVLYERLLEVVSVDQLRGLVRYYLKARKNWRSDEPQM
jgi:hypothetical protein